MPDWHLPERYRPAPNEHIADAIAKALFSMDERDRILMEHVQKLERQLEDLYCQHCGETVKVKYDV